MEKVVPDHMAAPSFEHAKTLVLMHVAGGQDRLLTHDPLALHLGVASHVIMDEPVPPEKLRGTISYIFDANVINEDIARLALVGMLGGKPRPNRDPNAVGTAVEEGLHAYLMLVTEMTP